MTSTAGISVQRDGKATLIRLNLNSRTGKYETKGEFYLRLTPEDRRWLLAELVSN